MTYIRVRNVVALVTASALFTAAILGTKVKLHILASHLITAANRLFAVLDFRCYALSDGIAEVCAFSAPRHTDRRLVRHAPAHPGTR